MTFEEYISEITKDTRGFFYGIWWKTKPQIFFIVDKGFNVVFETPAFNEFGKLTDEVNKNLELCGIVKDTAKIRTDDDLEALKSRLKKDYEFYMVTKNKTQLA